MILASHLYFSDRYFIDELFRMHCSGTGTDYCVLNFLAWLPHSVFREQVLHSLVESKKEEI